MSDHCSEHSRHFPVPFDQVLRLVSGPVTDAATSNRALVPIPAHAEIVTEMLPETKIRPYFAFMKLSDIEDGDKLVTKR